MPALCALFYYDVWYTASHVKITETYSLCTFYHECLPLVNKKKSQVAEKTNFLQKCPFAAGEKGLDSRVQAGFAGRLGSVCCTRPRKAPRFSTARRFPAPSPLLFPREKGILWDGRPRPLRAGQGPAPLTGPGPQKGRPLAQSVRGRGTGPEKGKKEES